MLYRKDEHMPGRCCVDVLLLLLLFAMVWCVWTANSWLVWTQRAALSHVYCLPALCLSLCIFCLSIISTFILSSSVMLCDLLRHVLHWNTDELSTHTRLSDTLRTVQAASSIVYSVFSSVIAFFFIALSLSKNESHSAPGSAAGLHDGTTVTHCFIYIYSRSCHFKCRAKNLMSSHTSNTHTQGNH